MVVFVLAISILVLAIIFSQIYVQLLSLLFPILYEVKMFFLHIFKVADMLGHRLIIYYHWEFP